MLGLSLCMMQVSDGQALAETELAMAHFIYQEPQPRETFRKGVQQQQHTPMKKPTSPNLSCTPAEDAQASN